MRDGTWKFRLTVFLSMTLVCSPVFAAQPADEETLVRDGNAFAVDLYQKLSSSDGNLFFSPYSISSALAMTYAGARGNTEKEMAKALRFSLRQKELHPAFAALESRLNEVQKAGRVKLSVANSLWPQQDYKFKDEYLSLVKKYYGVSVTPVDYKHAVEAARVRINAWVEEKTQKKIRDLIPAGILNSLTRLVLVNAIYFKGSWKNRFEVAKTKEASFYTSPGKPVRTPMMTQRREFGYAETDDLQALEMPYAGDDLSMIVLLPRKADGLKSLEDKLTSETIQQWELLMKMKEVFVSFPKFKTTSMFRLNKTLESLGMLDAFNVKKANFAGMDGLTDLFIAAVVHKAFVDVDEEGTEAAAATTAVVDFDYAVTPLPPSFRADHPFVFLIRENRTGSILFMGRTSDPTKTAE